ncbi:MAG: thioredoxin family protein [Chitinophagaceae bacterium]|nr:thioredoxin family protein [Chitinophagaceae bacterium]
MKAVLLPKSSPWLSQWQKILLAVMLLPALSLLSFSLKEKNLPIGAELPKADVKLRDITGKEITLKTSMKENGLLVMFSCNTCPVVVKNQGRAKEICQYSLSKNVGVVVLNSNEANRNDDESLDAMKNYAKAQAYSWYYAVDKNSELADAFGANRTPECFLFDKNGKLVYHGAIDNNPNDEGNVSRHHLKEAVDELVNGKDVSVKETRSVGCNIKRM